MMAWLFIKNSNLYGMLPVTQQGPPTFFVPLSLVSVMRDFLLLGTTSSTRFSLNSHLCIVLHLEQPMVLSPNDVLAFDIEDMSNSMQFSTASIVLSTNSLVLFESAFSVHNFFQCWSFADESSVPNHCGTW